MIRNKIRCLLFVFVCTASAQSEDWGSLQKEVKHSVEQADYVVVAEPPDSFWASGMIFGRFEVIEIIWEGPDLEGLRENKHIRVAIKIEKERPEQGLEAFRGSDKVILFLKSTPHGYLQHIRSEAPVLLSADNEKLIDLVNLAVQLKRHNANEK